MQQNERYHQGFSDLINAKNGMVYLDTQRVRVCVRGNEASGYRWLPSGEVFPFFELRAAGQCAIQSELILFWFAFPFYRAAFVIDTPLCMHLPFV